MPGYHRSMSLWFHQCLPVTIFALIVLLYRQFWTSTLHGVWSFPNHVVTVSHTTSCNHHVLFIQENVVSDHASEYVCLEVLAPIKDVSLGIGTWESSSPFRASDEAVRWRRSSNGVQRKRSHGAQSDSTRYVVTHTEKEKPHGRPRSFPPFNGPDTLLSPRSMHPSLFLCVFPPFINLGTRFHLRGRAVTSRVSETLIKLLVIN
jgi:hypothetical protein